MLDHALTLGSKATKGISWESAHTFFERRMKQEIALRASTWTRHQEYNKPGNHPLLTFVSLPAGRIE